MAGLLDRIGDVGHSTTATVSLRNDTGVLRARNTAGIVPGKRGELDGGL